MKLAKLKVFSAHDLKLNIYMAPMVAVHTGQMLRQWQDLVNDKSTIMGRHPMDFRLVQVAEFDDATGTFESKEPFPVASPGEYVSVPQPELPGISVAGSQAQRAARV